MIGSTPPCISLKWQKVRDNVQGLSRSCLIQILSTALLLVRPEFFIWSCLCNYFHFHIFIRSSKNKIKALCKLIWTDREQKVKAFVFHCEFMSLFPLILLLYGGIITVPEKKLYFQRTFSSVSMSNHQWLQLMIIFRILGWTSGTNFIDKKNVWKHCQCIEQRWKNILKRWKNILKRWKQLPAFEGKRCKCVENHWNPFQCIVTHSKCVEMLFNANFVKPGFPK